MKKQQTIRRHKFSSSFRTKHNWRETVLRSNEIEYYQTRIVFHSFSLGKWWKARYGLWPMDMNKNYFVYSNIEIEVLCISRVSKQRCVFFMVKNNKYVEMCGQKNEYWHFVSGKYSGDWFTWQIMRNNNIILYLALWLQSSRGKFIWIHGSANVLM